MSREEIRKLTREQEIDDKTFCIRRQIINPTKKFYLETLTAREKIIWICVTSKLITEKELSEEINIDRVSISRVLSRAKMKLKEAEKVT